MGENSAIEWCDHTFNPWVGCQKVGPGCDHCYAEARDIRFEGGKHWGPHAPRRRTSPANWAQVRRWNRKAQAFRVQHGHWPRVFCASLADIGDTSVDRAWHRDFWELVRECRDLRFILLTKRIGNMPGLLPFGWLDGDFDHVGVMITIVNQDEANRDVKKLVNLPMAGRQWRGISHEPALGGVDWSPWIADLDWIIYGGESGPDARPTHPDWARADRDQCAAAGVAFMMKQWGGWLPGLYWTRATPRCSIPPMAPIMGSASASRRTPRTSSTPGLTAPSPSHSRRRRQAVSSTAASIFNSRRRCHD